MKGSFIGILTATILIMFIAFIQGGFSLVGEGLQAAWRTFIRALPLVLVAFLVTGQIQVLLSRERLAGLWDRLAGTRGIFLSSVAGGLFPGPPYVYYPFLGAFKGKEFPAYFFFSFVVGKQIYDFTRLPMEMSLISPGIALIRNLITLPFPFLMGLFFRRFISRETTARFLAEGGE